MMVSPSEAQTQPLNYHQQQQQQPNHITTVGEVNVGPDQTQDILPLPPFPAGQVLDDGRLTLIEVIGHGSYHFRIF